MITRVLGCAVLTVGVVIASLWATGFGASAAQERPAAPTEWPPRTADGQPDIQGVWGSADTGIFSLAIEPMSHLLSIACRSAACRARAHRDRRPAGPKAHDRGRSANWHPPASAVGPGAQKQRDEGIRAAEAVAD